jgi:hypothetical protein
MFGLCGMNALRQRFGGKACEDDRMDGSNTGAGKLRFDRKMKVVEWFQKCSMKKRQSDLLSHHSHGGLGNHSV